MKAFEEHASNAWTWFKERAHGVHAQAWLVFAAFIDSWLVFFPPEILLVAILVAGAERWVYYATITTIAATAGGLVGYLIGAFFFDLIGVHILSFLDVQEIFLDAQEIFSNTAFWIIAAAALVPIPYVPFILAAGFFGVNIFVVLGATILGRAVRFFLIGYIIKAFGQETLRIVIKYSNVATILIVLVLLFWVLIHFDILPFAL